MGIWSELQEKAIPVLGIVGMASKFIPQLAWIAPAAGAVIGAGVAWENHEGFDGIVENAAIDAASVGFGNKLGRGVAEITDTAKAGKGTWSLLKGGAAAGLSSWFGSRFHDSLSGSHHDQNGDPGSGHQPKPDGTPKPAQYVQPGGVQRVDITDLNGQLLGWSGTSQPNGQVPSA
ncbi:hypothetical protein [Nocardia sp. NPDC046763]|uniref:hypothetical protein n=1 Tax=Nocardia sp. NPDC046763 TaxID=3155256 RepID=UPI0033C718A4